MVKLSKVQEKAIRKFIEQRNRYGALFMEPGTGKTLTIISIINQIPCDAVLWISSKALKTNTLDEFRKWGFSKKCHFVGIDQLKTGNAPFNNAIEFCKTNSRIACVFDESTRIKNRNTTSYVRARYLRNEYCEFAFVLNGTPITQSERDLWCQMNFLSPKILKMNYTEYLDLIEERVVYKKRGEKEKSFCSGFVNMDYVEKLINPYVVYGDLGIDVNYTKQILTYGIDVEIMSYNEFSAFTQKNGVDILSVMQSVQHKYSIDKARVESIAKFVDNKTLIFVKYLDTKELLDKKYPQALTMTYGTGAVGLNLQQYKRTIFYDLTFDFYNQKQAMYRTYRTGQDSDVEFINIKSGWLDDLIYDNLVKKGDLHRLLSEITNKSKEKTIEDL